MGNVVSDTNALDGSASCNQRCPGAFPIQTTSDKASRRQHQGDKQPLKALQTVPISSPSATLRDDPDKPHPGHQAQLRLLRGFESKWLSSQIRAPSASLVLENGVSLEHDFERLCLLGESTEGCVYKIRSRSKPSEVYALKVLKEKAHSRLACHLPSEYLLHLKIDIHPHLLFMPQIDITADRDILMCTTFANAGDLYGQIRRFAEHRICTPPIFALHVFVQIAEALAFLHPGYRRMSYHNWKQDEDFIPIIHGDLKPENVFLKVNPRKEHSMPRILLGDFGHAVPASEPALVSGSPLFFCPEAKAASRGDFSGPMMSTKSDVYTFGLTLYVLLTFQHWETGMHSSMLALQPEYDEIGFTGILKHCLAVNPVHRPSMDCTFGTGLLTCVDDAWTLRDELFRKQGPLEKNLWKYEWA